MRYQLHFGEIVRYYSDRVDALDAFDALETAADLLLCILWVEDTWEGEEIDRYEPNN